MVAGVWVREIETDEMETKKDREMKTQNRLQRLTSLPLLLPGLAPTPGCCPTRRLASSLRDWPNPDPRLPIEDLTPARFPACSVRRVYIISHHSTYSGCHPCDVLLLIYTGAFGNHIDYTAGTSGSVKVQYATGFFLLFCFFIFLFFVGDMFSLLSLFKIFKNQQANTQRLHTREWISERVKIVEYVILLIRRAHRFFMFSPF